MNDRSGKKIIRLLGVGFDAQDGHVRITQGDQYDVIMGSDESHEYLRKLIQKIESKIGESGLSLNDLTPEKLTELVESLK
jgi:hypothetical protein